MRCNHALGRYEGFSRRSFASSSSRVIKDAFPGILSMQCTAKYLSLTPAAKPPTFLHLRARYIPCTSRMHTTFVAPPERFHILFGRERVHHAEIIRRRLRTCSVFLQSWRKRPSGIERNGPEALLHHLMSMNLFRQRTTKTMEREYSVGLPPKLRRLSSFDQTEKTQKKFISFIFNKIYSEKQ